MNIIWRPGTCSTFPRDRYFKVPGPCKSTRYDRSLRDLRESSHQANEAGTGWRPRSRGRAVAVGRPNVPVAVVLPLDEKVTVVPHLESDQGARVVRVGRAGTGGVSRDPRTRGPHPPGPATRPCPRALFFVGNFTRPRGSPAKRACASNMVNV